jgi:succinyl-CoA synthetase beta subunit
MDLHEYQTKILLKQYNLPIPKGAVIRNIDETMDTIAYVGGKEWVLKAQIHSEGRGSAGGIRIVATEEELYATIKSMVGSTLITEHNSPQGQPINQVLIETRVNDIAREIQFILNINHNTAHIELTLITNANPSANQPLTYKMTINPLIGLQTYQCYELFLKLQLEAYQQLPFTTLLKNLYRLFVEKDLVWLSVNPLAITKNGDFIFLDAKAMTDDHALFRQARIRHMRDITQEQAREARARQCGFQFMQLKGSIACLVNGLGSMLTAFDSLQEKNISPASFLDLQSNIDQQSIIEAFQIMISDDQINAVFVNICTRLTDCHLITEGIVSAIAELHFNLPIVVNLYGYNAKEALKKFEQNNFGIIISHNITQAINHLIQYKDGVMQL